MKLVDERIIYIIHPMELMANVKKAFSKSGLKVVEERMYESKWFLKGLRKGLKVDAELASKRKIIDGLEIIGETHVSRLIVKASGDKELIEKFKRDLEVSLLRCLG